MNRYGFDKKDLRFVVDRLKNNSNLNVKSICSHLSSAGDTTKLDVSKNQINLFKDISKTLEENLNKKIERHILNSNGFMNFPEKQMNMVRLGISLYGSYKNTNLQQISKLKSVISQNRNIEKGRGCWIFI